MSMNNNQPLFIDFEASSLNMIESYPIQVAYSMPSGEIICRLINPDFIDDWDDWNFYAEHAIHGFSRKYLRENGWDPFRVALEMNRNLNTQVLYTNAPDYDGFWRDRLFQAVGLERTFRFLSSDELFLSQMKVPISLDELILDMNPINEKKEKLLDEISQRAWQLVSGKQHQADVDVKQLIEMWKIIQNERTADEW